MVSLSKTVEGQGYFTDQIVNERLLNWIVYFDLLTTSLSFFRTPRVHTCMDTRFTLLQFWPSAWGVRQGNYFLLVCWWQCVIFPRVLTCKRIKRKKQCLTEKNYFLLVEFRGWHLDWRRQEFIHTLFNPPTYKHRHALQSKFISVRKYMSRFFYLSPLQIF